MTAVEAPAQSPKGILRSVARAILWPVRRFFDPRFTGVHEAVQDVKRVVIADMDAANEASVLTGRTLDTLLAQNEATARAGRADAQRVEGLYSRFLFDPEADHSLEDLDDGVGTDTQLRLEPPGLRLPGEPLVQPAGPRRLHVGGRRSAVGQ